MSKHEQYEELCTLAMIGEVSATEMQDLRQHLSECADCREQYREFTQFLLPQLSISTENDPAFEAGYSAADKVRLRTNFLNHAQSSGLSFSEDAMRGVPESAPQSASSRVLPMRSQWRHMPRYGGAIAASIAALLFAAGYGTHLALVHHAKTVSQNQTESPFAGSTSRLGSQPVATLPQSPALDPVLVQLRQAGEADQKTIAALQAKLTETVARMQAVEQTLSSYQATQTTLQDQLNDKNKQLASLQTQVQGDAQTANDLRAQAAQLQQRLTENQTTLAANQIRLRDLSGQLSTQTASLGREQEMLSVGRDVRDLMGARNLHIIDVRDSNGAGKDRPSFGRVFYTEGKSLIFYAFDLDDKKVVNANYSFEAWGERLGQPSSVKSLGVLYSDDKLQRRWSLKVNDPHQLAEINSVFVTLELHKGENDKPHGQRILYAYLGGEPNHP